ncbi:unnamed protein product [Ambrosiozyma monospora]|uniref:Unnamed protein product n=1 Tax=Ambrosiozyma monospora TaxID=43982 RepID=A0ACB5UD27_AMBMO|nr:unnamed protein product [Ambrosiozyma monospora]
MRLLKEYKLSDVLEYKSSYDVRFEELLASLEFRIKHLANNKPLWGLIVYDSRTLILWSEHILGDGTSFKNFHIEFLKILNGTANVTGELINTHYNGLDSVIFKDQWFESRDISPEQTYIIDYKPSPQTWTQVFLEYYFPYVYKLYNNFRKDRTKFEPVAKHLMVVDEDTAIMRRKHIMLN